MRDPGEAIARARALMAEADELARQASAHQVAALAHMDQASAAARDATAQAVRAADAALGHTEPLMAAPRDASWYPRPGRASKVHVAVVDRLDSGFETWFASCTGAALDEHTSLPAAEVPGRRRCQRHGCREQWPAQQETSDG